MPGESRPSLPDESDAAELRVLLDHVVDVVARIDTGVVQWVSPSVTDLLGYRPEELRGRQMLELSHPDDHEVVLASRARLAGTGRSQHRVRFLHRDGSWRWLEAKHASVPDRDGVVRSASVVTWRDFTDEQVVAERLARSEREYRLLAENASDGVVRADRDGVLQWISSSVESLAGRPVAEMLGRPFSELVHPDDRSTVSAAQAALVSGEAARFEIRLATASGAHRWISVSARPIIEGGDVVGQVAGWRDVDDRITAQQALDADRLRLRATVDSLLDPHVLLEAVRDVAGTIVDFVYGDANASACSYMQMTKDQLVGARLLDLLPGQAGSGMLKIYADAVESGVPLELDDYSYPHEILGSDRRYDIRAVRVGDALSFTWRDITDRYATTLALAASEEKFRLIADNSSDVVMRLRSSGVVWVSPSITDAIGWTPEEWVETLLETYIHPDDMEIFEDGRAKIRAGQRVVSRFRLRAKDSSYHWVEHHVSGYFDADGRRDGAVVSWRVVDAEVAAEQSLTVRARFDELTGLINRQEALEQLTGILSHPPRQGRELAVAFCDLDNFKTVNDSLGHAAGDDVLRVVGGRVRASVRHDDLVARLGGDEILVVLCGVTDLAAAVNVAEKIRSVAAQPVPTGDGSVGVTLSIGITLAHAGDDIDTLIARADQAMYEAKRTGRDRVIVFPDVS